MGLGDGGCLKPFRQLVFKADTPIENLRSSKHIKHTVIKSVMHWPFTIDNSSCGVSKTMVCMKL